MGSLCAHLAEVLRIFHFLRAEQDEWWVGGWSSSPMSVSPQTEGPFLPTISKLTIHHRKLHFLENKEK